MAFFYPHGWVQRSNQATAPISSVASVRHCSTLPPLRSLRSSCRSWSLAVARPWREFFVGGNVGLDRGRYPLVIEHSCHSYIESGHL